MLNNVIKIYIPSTTDGNKPAKRMQAKETKRAAKYFCSYFGGATKTTATGFWQSDTKGLTEERQNIIYSFCESEQVTEHKSKIFAYAKRLCRRMKQEAVTIEINNAMYFVEQ